MAPLNMTIAGNFTEIISNITMNSEDCADGNCYQPSMPMNEFKIIKAVFLAVVTLIILISVCKMVFQLFVQYSVKHDR